MFRVCDPLYGYIHFNKDEWKLIGQAHFQRLRSIGQLGFVQYAYPGAVHNRLTHALGVCHLAGQAFDNIFKPQSSNELNITAKKKRELKNALKLSALLHDLGHGPLSHTGELFMPPLKHLNLSRWLKGDRQARHEDYTVKFIMDSDLTAVIKSTGLQPLCLARLIHPDIKGGEDFFEEGDRNFLPLLRQIISSDLDVDRMDYIHRDSYFCGVNYGHVDSKWLLSHFTFHPHEGKLYLALNKEALWTAESFLLGRHHMHLSVYFHHKPVIYEQMLVKYKESGGDTWTLPCDTDSFALCTDNALFEKLKTVAENNEWARRILKKEPYERFYESGFFVTDPLVETEQEREIQRIRKKLSDAGLPFISANSSDHSLQPVSKHSEKNSVYVKDRWTGKCKTLHEEQAILKFQKRRIHRIYLNPKDREKAEKIRS